MLANKALGPWASGPRALLANIPTPLNFKLGNTDTVQYSTGLKELLARTRGATGPD